MSSGQLSSQQTIQLSTLVKGCKQVLEDLDGKLKKYEGLDTHASSLGPKTGSLWKKLKWDQSEVDALRSRLISNNTSLEIFYSGLARYSLPSEIIQALFKESFLSSSFVPQSLEYFVSLPSPNLETWWIV